MLSNTRQHLLNIENDPGHSDVETHEANLNLGLSSDLPTKGRERWPMKSTT
jgi:hypothetical protein